MKSLIVVTLFMMLFLAFSARNQNLRLDEPTLVHSREDAGTRAKRLEAEKAEVVYSHWLRRCECLSGAHGENHKDLKDAELKRELARLDLEIAKIRSE